MKAEGWFVEFYGNVEERTYVAYDLNQFLSFLHGKGKVVRAVHFNLPFGKVYTFRHREFPFRFRFLPSKFEFNPYFLSSDLWATIELPPLERGVTALPVFETELWVVVKNVS